MLSGENMVDAARAVAFCAHAGQYDKIGRPYAEHVVAVASQFDDCDRRAVAYLHDTVEDTQVTVAALAQAGFPERVVRAVDRMTHREGKSYESYVETLSHNDLARDVKIADLADHLDPANATGLDEAHRTKYERACAYLISVRRGQPLPGYGLDVRE